MNALKFVPSAEWWTLSLSAGVYGGWPFPGLTFELRWSRAGQSMRKRQAWTWHQMSFEGFN